MRYKDKLIIVGDFNRDLRDTQKSTVVDFYDRIIEANYSPLIKTPTRSTKHSETITDQNFAHNG